MPKGKRGYKLTDTKLEDLLNLIDKIVLVGNPEWEQFWEWHYANFVDKDRMVE
jgi:hypothetical protein